MNWLVASYVRVAGVWRPATYVRRNGRLWFRTHADPYGRPMPGTGHPFTP